MNCRHCKTTLTHYFLDLGFAPPSNAYLSSNDLHSPETTYPLRVMVCDQCWLVQTEDFTQAKALFDDNYAYFSSTSTSWLTHAAQYVSDITHRLALNAKSFVIEIASNDGYLLKNFIQANIPCLGIEPTASTAIAAEKIGIPVMREFFGEKLGVALAHTQKQADLIIGNNVYAHVPDINDFTRGMKAALKENGVITLEFPHVLELIKENQFDTVYHEHFSYLSLYTVSQIFQSHGLRVFDIEKLSTHGGSLRVFGCHNNDPRETTKNVLDLIENEKSFGLTTLKVYQAFQQQADQIKNNLISFLIEQKKQGKTIAGYGAAAKGNTLLNYAGIKPDLLPYICDAAPAKQNQFMPGSHIPILPPNVIKERRPESILILPWNIADEVRQQLSFIQKWGGRFVTAVPHLTM